MGMFGSDAAELRAYRVGLNKALEFAPWYAESYWASQMGFIKSPGNYPVSVNLGSSETKRLTPTGKSVEVLTNFMHDGGDAMDIPLINPLIGTPIFDTQARGTEEEVMMTYKTAHLHIYRHPVIIQDSPMGAQKLQETAWKKMLMKGAKEQLGDYFSRVINFQPYNALLYKYSDNLFLPTATRGGRGLGIVSHPNFYVEGYGRASYPSGNTTWTNLPGTAAYETDVATAVTTLTNDSTKRMSAKLIRKMVNTAIQLKIQPNTPYRGRKYFNIVISQAAAWDLLEDATYKRDYAWADMGKGDDARTITGQVEGIYFNAFISVDMNMPTVKVTGDTGYDSNYTVSYANCQDGTTHYIKQPYDRGNRKLAILHGAGAVVAAQAQPLGFTKETFDYEYVKSEEGRMMVGFERCDITDFDGRFGTAGAIQQNASSLVWAHWGDDDVASL